MILLRKTRLLQGLSMEKLAVKAGVNWGTIKDHEQGTSRRYHPATALLIANALEVGLEELFTIEEGRWVDREVAPERSTIIDFPRHPGETYIETITVGNDDVAN